MVCGRCLMYVKEILKQEGVEYNSMELGEVDTKKELTKVQAESIAGSLKKFDLELLNDKNSILIEKIKNVIIEMIHYSEKEPIENYSEFISKKLNKDYNSLSHLFSKIKGTTIEQYIIAQKIEKVKEYLLFDELSLSEIAYKLNYSSVSHLSKQFKKVTGLNPSFFKTSSVSKKKRIEEI